MSTCFFHLSNNRQTREDDLRQLQAHPPGSVQPIRENTDTLSLSLSLLLFYLERRKQGQTIRVRGSVSDLKIRERVTLPYLQRSFSSSSISLSIVDHDVQKRAIIRFSSRFSHFSNLISFMRDSNLSLSMMTNCWFVGLFHANW